MPPLSVAIYDTYREQNGRDPVLDTLLCKPRTLVCLQEISIPRAWEIKRSFKARSFITPMRLRYGLRFLAVMLPEGARFVERRTVQLTSHWGLVPEAWCLRWSYQLYKSGSRRWRNALSPHAAQVSWVLWEGRVFRLVNAHLPWQIELRPRCLDKLRSPLVGGEDVLLVGDLNSTTENFFLADLMKATELRSLGPTSDTLRRERVMIDHVLFSGGGFREVEYSLEESLSDHPLVCIVLEEKKYEEYQPPYPTRA